MAVDAVGFAVNGGEKVPESDVTTEGGGANDQGDRLGIERVTAEFDGLSDTAMAGRAIKS